MSFVGKSVVFLGKLKCGEKSKKKGFPVTTMEHILVKFSCGGFVRISGKKRSPILPKLLLAVHTYSVSRNSPQKNRRGGKLHRLFSQILFPRNNGGDFHSGENESFVFSSSSEEIFEMSEK